MSVEAEPRSESPGAVLTVRRVGLRYDPGEDRLLLLAEGEEAVWPLWLTRRLTFRLVSELEGWLRRDSPTLRTLPESPLREWEGEVLAMEHARALQRGEEIEAQARRERPPLKRPEEPARLVTGMAQRVDGELLSFDFQLGTARVRLKLQRSDGHRLLDLLLRQTEQAGWRGTAGVEWADAGRQAPPTESRRLH